MTDLPPGRELDALVAEKVMGATIARDGSLIWESRPEGSLAPWGRLRNYSTSIVDAWRVVEWLGQEWEVVDLRYVRHMNKWAVMKPVGNAMASVVVAKTAPHAICLAALHILEPRAH